MKDVWTADELNRLREDVLELNKKHEKVLWKKKDKIVKRYIDFLYTIDTRIRSRFIEAETIK